MVFELQGWCSYFCFHKDPWGWWSNLPFPPKIIGPSNGSITLPNNSETFTKTPCVGFTPQEAIVTTGDDIPFTIVAILNLNLHFVIWIPGGWGMLQPIWFSRNWWKTKKWSSENIIKMPGEEWDEPVLDYCHPASEDPKWFKKWPTPPPPELTACPWK